MKRMSIVLLGLACAALATAAIVDREVGARDEVRLLSSVDVPSVAQLAVIETELASFESVVLVDHATQPGEILFYEFPLQQHEPFVLSHADLMPNERTTIDALLEVSAWPSTSPGYRAHEREVDRPADGLLIGVTEI